MELCVVVLIVGLISSVALPQLLPLLIYSELEAEARRLANYGSGVVAEAALFGTELTVLFDLDAQEYYAVRMVYPDDETGEAGDQLSLFSSFRASGNYSATELSQMMSSGDRRLTGALPDDFDPSAADAQMANRFDTRYHQLLYARAKNVKHDAGFLTEIGPLFEREFSLSWSEPYEEELSDPILRRYKFPEGVRLDAVYTEGASGGRGLIEIPVSPLGLDNRVVIHLRNEDGDYHTVTWNPLTGRGLTQQGRLD